MFFKGQNISYNYFWFVILYISNYICAVTQNEKSLASFPQSHGCGRKVCQGQQNLPQRSDVTHNTSQGNRWLSFLRFDALQMSFLDHLYVRLQKLCPLKQAKAMCDCERTQSMDVRASPTVEVFKNKLKTHLFLHVLIWFFILLFLVYLSHFYNEY